MTPAAEESLLGYLKRRSDAEGFAEVGGYLALLGVRYGRSDFSAPETMSERLKLDLAILDEMLPRARAKDPALDWAFHRMHRDPVCPVCIAEGLPRRREWRHALVSACAIHKVRLIDECPECGEALTIDGDGHAGCLCGSRYGDATTSPASAVEIEVSRFMAGQEAELAGFAIDSIRDPRAPRTLWFLATGMTEGPMGKAGKSRLPRTVKETRELIDPLNDLLFEWPRAFDYHIATRWNGPGTEGQTAAQRLGAWYRGLVRLRGALGERLIDRCHTVAGQQLGDPYKTHSAGEDGDWISAAEAGRVLGIRAERVVEAVRANAVVGRLARSGSGHQHTVISRDAVERVKSLRSRYLDKSSARDLMGVSRKQFDLLEDSGFVRQDADASHHPCIDGRYDGDALAEKPQFLRIGVSKPATTGADVITFKELTLRRTTDRAALLGLFRKIATGEIKSVRWPEGAPLSHAEFDNAEISTQLKQLGAARSWTAGEVATMTGWKPECVTHWCQLGIIQAERSARGSMPAWQISGLS